MRSNLKLIHTTPPPHHTTTTTTSARADPLSRGGVVVEVAADVVVMGPVVVRVWEYWRGLLREGLPVARALSAERRRVIETALTDWGFDEETLRLALEGCAGSAWCMGRNRAGRRFDDLGWLFASAERIERLAAEGQQFRAWMQREATTQEAAPSPEWEPKSAEMQARLAAVRAAAQRRIGGR